MYATEAEILYDANVNRGSSDTGKRDRRFQVQKNLEDRQTVERGVEGGKKQKKPRPPGRAKAPFMGKRVGVFPTTYTVAPWRQCRS